MNDRFKFRLPFYNNDGEFSHFQYFDIAEGIKPYNAGVMFHRDEYEQCTGLKDKNGNLIYESDYVKDKDGDIYLVKWDAELVQFNATGKDDCGFETLTAFMKGETETLEICGNIHETKE